MNDNSEDIEDLYFSDRKEGKKNRKLASSKDQSKYKKTDKEKYLKTLEKELLDKSKKKELVEGTVISVTPQGILVQEEENQFWCSLKGLLKREKTQAKNLVTVGDQVLFEKLQSNEGSIAHVLPRRTKLCRSDNLSRKKEHLIASNIDQVLITTSVVDPALKPPLIDRYIIAAQKGGMTPILVINKIDLLTADHPIAASEKELLQELITTYESLSIPCFCVSTETGEGIEQLKKTMKDRSSVFSGQSGVGKSSLINATTGSILKIGDTVEKTGKGSHTTTSAKLIPLSDGGFCVDTPGIKSFGVWDLEKNEVEGYFTEIHEKGHECRFPSCSHTNEEGCKVIEAVVVGLISPLRYQSYQTLLESIKEKHVKR